MSEAPVMIRCERLTKVYGKRPAVKAVTFEVKKGEVIGFIGPNGAGKSTTMKMLTCYLTPTSGRAEVAGFDIHAQSLDVRRRVGYLPEEAPIYRDMSVLEYLRYVAELREIPRRYQKDRIKEVGGTCGVLDVLGKKVGELSRGYRQRVGLTQALIHDPPVLILDDVTNGLDPNQIVDIRKLIQDLGKEKAVFLSSHILPEIEATCGRVLMITEGEIVADGAPRELAASDQGASRFRLVLAEGDQAAIRAKLRGIAGVADVLEEPASGAAAFAVLADGQKDLRRELARAVADNAWPLLELSRREPSLEDFFYRVTRKTGTVPAVAEKAA
jgi:ABC-2 type transport system ATP-binding protein